LTYAEALSKVNALARWLRGRAVRPGDRVLVAVRNRVETPLIVFAAAKIGAIFSIVSPQLKPSGFARVVEQCEPALIFVDSDTATLRAEVAGVPVVWLDPQPTVAAEGDASFSDTIASSGDEELPVPGGEVPAFLVFTSGSTAAPRGVILTHANVEFVTRAIQARLRYQARDRIGLLLPFSFDYGLYQVFYVAMCGGQLYVGRPEKCGPELPRLLAKAEVTVLPVVPTLAAALIKALRFRPVPLPGLRIITNTGDHLPQAHIEQIRELLPNVRVFPMYGLTECKRVSILLPEQLETHPDSVGRPLDGTEVWAEAPDGSRLPPGEVGQLVVKGPHVSPGYWRDPAGTAARFRQDKEGGRVLMTGDFGAVDDQHFIRFHSRGEHVIKHRGHWLSPAEVEEAACRDPKVAAAGCVRDDTRDLLCLFVATVGPPPEPADVLANLATRIERAKLPDKVIFLDDLPRTPNQKVDRATLRALLPTFS
ncbi:MAG TPA: class I adenylate-forming enzyme family protein, partial [Prosthecobacter sp.]|nr:class I adenylate-forming enzyme family protein [Prosthecobacter sp.]